MTPRTLRLPLLVAMACALLVPGMAQADKPTWKPVAELLVGSLSESDPVRMSNVMTRCTALNMIFVGLVADEAPDMSQHYRAEAQKLIQNAMLIDSRLEKESTGVDADIPALSNATIEKVKGLVSDYNEWLDYNMATESSYLSKDLYLEMDSCRLASRFVSQI